MNQFHRVGRWSLSLFAPLGVFAAPAYAQEQERGEIPQPEIASVEQVQQAPAANATIEIREEFSFLFVMPSDPTVWKATVPEKAGPEQATVTIAIYATPVLPDAEPVATLVVNDAQIVPSPDPLAPGFALFLEAGIDGSDIPPILFAWDALHGVYQMLGQISGNLLGPLYEQESSAEAPPPPLDFELIVAALGWDAEIAEILAAMWRIASFANSGDPEAAQAFVNLFLLLPPEAQQLVIDFLNLSMQTEDSPFEEIVAWVVENAAPAYESYIKYLKEQAALLYFLAQSTAPAPASSEVSAHESSGSETGEWSAAVAFTEDAAERGAGASYWQDASHSPALGSLSLASRDGLSETEISAREAEKSGSRNGTQEIAGSRAGKERSAKERARLLDDFLAKFASGEMAGENFSLFPPEAPERPEPRRDFEKLVASELRRRIGSHARRV